MFTKKNLHLGQHLYDYQLYQIECPFYGWGRDLYKNAGVSTDTFIFIKQGKESWFYFNLPEWRKEGQKYFNIIYRQPAKLIRVLDRIIDNATLLFNHCQTIPPAAALKKINDAKLYAIYDTFHKYHHIYWNLAMTPNLLEAENSYLTDYVMARVEKNKARCHTEMPVFEIFNKLTAFTRTTWIEKKNDDYLKLLIRLKNKKQDRSLIEAFYHKYCWLEYNWSGPPENKAELYKKIKNDLHNSAADFRQELRDKTRIRKNDLRLKKKFLRELRLSAKEKILVGALEKLYFSKSYRMECSYFAYYHMERVFKEIGRRLHLTLPQVWSILPEEMERHLVKHDVDTTGLTGLYNNSALVWNGRTSRLILGAAVKKLKKSMQEADYIKGKTITELKGQTAFNGRVTGTCKVINHRSEMAKFKKGEILISDFTDPSLMPAIVKAAAIVTNFGGMTCHAAIVSRELKIPCIVGTKIATQVLKDGDRVEVDAAKGIIKKL